MIISIVPYLAKAIPSMKRQVLLTIDDSPSPLMAMRLDYLRPLGVPILWFCRGDNLAERPETAIQALRDGHTLGNHSWDHAMFSKLSLEEAADQIDRTETALEDIHRRAGVPRRLRCFRFPYETTIGTPDHHEALQDLLRRRGFEAPNLPAIQDAGFRQRVARGDLSWSWTYDLEDWTLRSSDSPEAAAVLEKVLTRLTTEIPARTEPLDVFVGHDHAHTVGQWEAVLLRLLDLGCEFLTTEDARAL